MPLTALINILTKRTKLMKKVKTLLKTNRFIAYIGAVFCTLLWGTAFPFIKLGYSAFQIADNDIGAMLLFAGFRFTLAGIMVYAVLCVKEKKPFLLGRNDILPVAVLGLVQTFGQYIFTYIGIGFTSSTNTSIITACGSFFTVLLASLFFKNDKLTVLKIAGCAVGFAGVLAVNRGVAINIDTLFGDIMILFSTVSAASGNIISKKISLGRNPMKMTAFQLTIGGVALVAIGLVLGGRLAVVSVQSVLILLWLAFVSAGAFSLWSFLLKYHPASVISVFNLLVPIFGTVLSGVILGEDVFRIETLISLVLIVAGIVLVNLNIKRCNLKT